MTLKEDIELTIKNAQAKITHWWENKIWGKKKAPQNYTGFKPSNVSAIGRPEPTVKYFKLKDPLVDKLVYKIINKELPYRDTGFDFLRAGKKEEICIFFNHTFKRVNISIVDDRVELTDSDSREAYEIFAEHKIIKHFKDLDEKEKLKKDLINNILY